ncbi:PRC-barrel domain containing protein [Halosolutus halophilus]|uniref:PRC-barrel domain containing protein n=1 Tax=Halosolutus halophilus TaxID=1552990 RepID=UPI002234FDFC|nr:PRC-barrel domain containing protein [Halosolutus halophilus]
MSANFTADDEGKRVVNAQGDEIGVVHDVERGTAHVKPDPGMTDTIKSKLGWGDADDETYALDADSVERITDDEVRLGRL